jgi:glycosidase
MKNIRNIFLFLFVSISAFAQPLGKTTEIQSEDITITPFPFGINDEITITIKSNNSCNSLGNEIMYVHSGVGTNANAWIYTQGNWGEDDGIGKMTNNGNGTHSITITPKTYFSIPTSEESSIEQMGMVFRNADGSKKWKYNENGCTDADYFVGVGNFQIDLVSPIVSDDNVIIMSSGDNLNIKVNSTETANFSIMENNVEIKTYSNVTNIDFTKIVTATSAYSIDVNNGSEIKNISFSVVIPPTAIVEELPTGLRDGINYYTDDKTKVTLVLHAPNKEFVYVKGDFSDWKIESKYQMKVTNANATNPDVRYWLTIDNLEDGKEYAFQYVVDAEKVLADPYTEKVLDPWNDPYIPEEIYPNLKKYPEGKTEGIVSVFQTGQPEYQWKATEYQKPEKGNLIIYELLVRDFVHKHSYQSILDTLDYIEKLNVNAIELMPINEFEGNESWGYNPSFMFAPDKYYGTKDKLKELIDEAHSRGIAVIIDIVMNHSFGQSPFVQLYDWHNGDGQIIMDEDTPWFNRESPNTEYHWGADFNHESIYTQALLDSINHFWMKEYKVDGFRFDFTKGFTNTIGPGHGYDASRIVILKRMYDKIVEVDPNAYVILEHLADNSEEKVLAEHGLMLWGNMVHNYSEAAMGYNEGDKSDLGWASYKKRGWAKPNLVSYSSSHDEERIAFKNSAYGNKNGTYNIKELETNMERMQLQAMFMLPIPGPKMIWQFDEIGYDISIDDPCRVCNKPIKWEYTREANRRRVYNLHKTIMKLKKTEPAFSTDNFTLDVDNGALKSIILEHDDMNVVIVGNFDVINKSINITFPSTGTWYNFFDDTEYEVSTTSQTISLAPGEYKMFTTKKLDTPNLDEDIVLSIDEISFDKSTNVGYINVYPVPTRGTATIKYSISAKSNVTIEIFDLQGRVVERKHFENQKGGTHSLSWEIDSSIKKGTYIVRISTPIETLSRTINIS